MSTVTGVAAIAVSVTGVGVPVGAVLEGISIGTGVAAAAIDCHKSIDRQCAINAAASTPGIAGGAVRIAGALGKIGKETSETGNLLLSFHSVDFAIPGEANAISNYMRAAVSTRAGSHASFPEVVCP